jgi:competence protein ComFC
MPTRLVHAVKCWLEAGLGFFYPEVCQSCGAERATAGDGFIGARCRDQVKFIAPPFCVRCGLPYEGNITAPFECSNCKEMDLHFAHARSAVAARGLVLDVIHRYKYQRALWFEPFLAGLLLEQAVPALREEAWDLILPVPLHPLKHAEREFNQAERLARRLGAATQIPVCTRTLRRVEPTRTQTQLSRRERAANVQRAFALRPGAAPAGRRIVLVDDVLTTGATTSACARILINAKARTVCVWTLARGLLT